MEPDLQKGKRADEFCEELARRCEELRRQGLWRELRRVDSEQSSRIIIGGKPCINFSSNDYLGLAAHPLLKEAAIKAVEKYGVGSGASRLICGSLAPHHLLEERIAQLKGVEAALSFSSGYLTAIGAICSIVGNDDIVLLDRLVHACLIDAAKLSGATLRVFRHNDTDHLESILKRLRNRTGTRTSKKRVLIVTESVFSMDGDVAPLKEIVELKEKYGAWLMVDEAHATGLFGEDRAGVISAYGLNELVEVQMGTLGKAIGSAGGFICGKKTLIDYLINRARSFIFTTAPLPAASAAAAEGIKIIVSNQGETRLGILRNLILQFKNSSIGERFSLNKAESAIFPIILGTNELATGVAAYLIKNGYYIPAIRFPTVPKNSARLRITLTANHTPEEVRLLALALESALQQFKDLLN
ncbi:MAG: aminotransferase class I/II-fold pyridoxal phosphate-dependent enzyme [Verrucomicrobiia bacterium]